MNILMLGPNKNELINYLLSLGDSVEICEDKIGDDSSVLAGKDFLISYGYRHILGNIVLDKFPKRAINLHVSLLPWNRGADPNLWSFLENTPKGVTIHYLDEGVDTGDILVQREVEMSQDETLRTSYEKLSGTIETLFKGSWLDIRERRIKPIPQKGGHSYHRISDRTKYEQLLSKGWDTPVSALVGKALIGKGLSICEGKK